MGIVIERYFDFEASIKKVKIHFFDFPDKWDEWYTEDNMSKLAPFGTHTEEPKDKLHGMIVLQRRSVANELTKT